MANALTFIILAIAGISAVIAISRIVSHSEWYHHWVNNTGDEDVTVTAYIPRVTGTPKGGIVYRESNVPAYPRDGWHEEGWTQDDLIALDNMPTVFDENHDGSYLYPAMDNERVANTFDNLPAITGDGWLDDRLKRTTDWFTAASLRTSSWRDEDWAVCMPWELNTGKKKRVLEITAA